MSNRPAALALDHRRLLKNLACPAVANLVHTQGLPLRTLPPFPALLRWPGAVPHARKGPRSPARIGRLPGGLVAGFLVRNSRRDPHPHRQPLPPGGQCDLVLMARAPARRPHRPPPWFWLPSLSIPAGSWRPDATGAPGGGRSGGQAVGNLGAGALSVPRFSKAHQRRPPGPHARRRLYRRRSSTAWAGRPTTKASRVV